MKLALTEPEFGVRSGGLRDYEAWWVQQVTVIDTELTTDRSFEPETEPASVSPYSTLVLADNIACRNGRRFEDIACFTKNIAAVVERNYTDGRRKRYPCLNIDDRQSVAAKWDRKWVKEDRVSAAISKSALRNN